MEIHSENLDQTARLGSAIGAAVVPGTIIGLNGTLGTGKTCLTQSIAMAIGIPEGNVVSPTFTICVPHQGTVQLLHLDAYRIQSPDEVDELALDEALEGGDVVIVEWVGLIENYLPPLDLKIEITAPSENSRVFLLGAETEKGRQLLKAIGEAVI